MNATAALLGLLLAVQATGQGAQAVPPYPPPGRLVDIGGWRLHLHCTGRANPRQPTVILEAGVGDFSVEWSLVQPRVAEFAQVCSYDRAGDGWSDLGPNPRTMRQIVYELHTLLERAAVTPPYVMVGHSYGAWPVRLYASTYPSEVVGMVLVEGGFDDPWRLTAQGKEVRSSDLASGRQVPAIGTKPLTEADVPQQAMSAMTAGAARAVATANDPPRDKLPLAAQRMRAWALGRWQHAAAAFNPFEAEELAALKAGRTTRQYPLGDMPVIVMTRGLSDQNGPDGARFVEERKREHELLASSLTRRGKHIVAARSGHHIQLDEPELVVAAIRHVVAGSPGP